MTLPCMGQRGQAFSPYASMLWDWDGGACGWGREGWIHLLEGAAYALDQPARVSAGIRRNVCVCVYALCTHQNHRGPLSPALIINYHLLLLLLLESIH